MSKPRGTTNSEHVFQYLLSLFMRYPQEGLMTTMYEGLARIVSWLAEMDLDPPVGLNIIPTDGTQMVGTRLNRSLF